MTAPQRDELPVTVVGAGLAGSLLSLLLARRGHSVHLHERLPDMRRESIPAGRSINLALAERGIAALEAAELMPQVLPLLIPMHGRMLHAPDGTLTFVPYGQREHEVIHSVSRPGLNRILLDAAEAAGVQMRFRHESVDVDFERNALLMRDDATGAGTEMPLQRVIAADGAGSPIRRALTGRAGVTCTESLLDHGYKELSLPADEHSGHRLHKNALHIWPRGGFMLIALPNIDGSFTVTLFLPHHGPHGFASLQRAADVEGFFQQHFPDVIDLIPDLSAQFAAHPTGIMGTIRCNTWAVSDELLLIGDAAHAITPFHGQGMNCAFEDCRVLDELLHSQQDWGHAFASFEQQRQPQTNAIADMALENYAEMRDTVRHPKFQLQKSLSLELERRFPQHFVPRYSMVMFHDEIPYSVAQSRGRIQGEILDELTRHAHGFDQVDFELARSLIEARLTPL